MILYPVFKNRKKCSDFPLCTLNHSKVYQSHCLHAFFQVIFLYLNSYAETSVYDLVTVLVSQILFFSLQFILLGAPGAKLSIYSAHHVIICFINIVSKDKTKQTSFRIVYCKNFRLLKEANTISCIV